MDFHIILDRLVRACWCFFAYTIRYFIRVRKDRVIFWAYGFKQYSCHPKYISDFIIANCPDEFDVVWVLNKDVNTSNIPKDVRVVYPHTLKYLCELYSSRFVITNSRNYMYENFFFKKKDQIYIMTWHGSIGLKKIEYDAKLGKAYERRMKNDNKICDLMLSNCDFFTGLIRNSFRYKGEILEKGVPRNDLFFNEKEIKAIKKRIWNDYNIPENNRIVMYAPTFRANGSADHYRLNWERLIPELEKKFDSKISVFIRLHPNSIKLISVKELINDARIIDMCLYHDMQELLCVTDVLITDYSSSMCDIGLLKKICFLYADDVSLYERGFYFDIRKMPFALAESEDELIDNIRKFDLKVYNKNLNDFYSNNINSYDDGHASEAVVEWMLSKMK